MNEPIFITDENGKRRWASVDAYHRITTLMANEGILIDAGNDDYAITPLFDQHRREWIYAHLWWIPGERKTYESILDSFLEDHGIELSQDEYDGISAVLITILRKLEDS